MKIFAKRILAVSLSMALALNMGIHTPDAAHAAGVRKEKTQTYIVQTATESKLEALDRKYEEGNTVSDLASDSMKEDNFTTLELTDSQAEALEKDKKVSIIEKDTEVKGCSENITGEEGESEEKEDVEWNMQAIRLDEGGKTEEETDNTAKVKVALIDSGVDMFDDIEVKDYINLIPGEEEVLPLFWDTSGHGTSIAGVIAAQDNDEGITGIAPDVELYSARVLDEDKTAPVSRIVEAIYWAIEKDVNIISLSFGTTVRSEALETAVKAAYDKGILIVAAAGNHGVVEYPAAMEEVMAVGGTDTDGTVCDYSAEGDEVEIVAPAEKIRSTGGFGGTIICNGTSMAVPHVVGVAARLWQKDLTKTADFIRQLMDVAANQYGDGKKYGNGLLDYEHALEVYDEFEENYRPWKTVEQNEEAVEENDAPVQEFTDVDYVNGSWCCDVTERKDKTIETNTHTSLAENALAQNGYTSGNMTSANVIAMVKRGAVYPDIQNQETDGISKHPCLHGYFKTTYGATTCNYIKNYITCTKFAVDIRKGKTYSTSGTTSDANDPNNEYTKLFANVSWGNLGSSNEYRAAFAYGVAMHTATDVYAHSVWTKQYGRLFHSTSNGNDYADRSDKVTQSFTAAKAVAVNILKHYRNNTAGTVSDFCTSVSYNAGIFKLYYFEHFIDSYSPTLAESMGVYSEPRMKR